VSEILTVGFTNSEFHDVLLARLLVQMRRPDEKVGGQNFETSLPNHKRPCGKQCLKIPTNDFPNSKFHDVSLVRLFVQMRGEELREPNEKVGGQNFEVLYWRANSTDNGDDNGDKQSV
jgi:hypothetical protein